MNILSRIINNYFDPSLGLRVRLFHILAMGGTVVSILMCIMDIANKSDFGTIAVNGTLAVLSFALLVYSRRSGRYQVCYIISIVVIFMILFPVLFFTSNLSAGR